jgi:hypothetical protein
MPGNVNLMLHSIMQIQFWSVIIWSQVCVEGTSFIFIMFVKYLLKFVEEN